MKRLASLLLLLPLFLLPLAGCRAKVPPESAESKTEIVYSSVELPYPADTGIHFFTAPTADADSILAVGTEKTPDGTLPVLLRFPRDGSPADTVHIPLPDGAWMNGGVFADGRLFLLYTVNTDGAYVRTLAEISLDDPAPTVTDRLPFDELPPEGRDHPVNLLARDADGFFYLFGYADVMILDAEFRFRGVFPLSASPSSAATLADGQVWVTMRMPGECRIARVDRDSGNLTDPHAVDSAARTLVPSAEHFGVCDCASGLLALDFDKNGALTEEPLLDFIEAGYAAAQDLDRLTNHPSILAEGQSLFLADAGPDSAGQRGFLFVTRENGYRLTLCTPREIPVSERRTLVLAHAHPLTDADRSLLVRFGRENPDVRLSRLDYSEYALSDAPDAGMQRLTIDILTGRAAPDLLCEPADSAKGDGILAVLCRKGYYLPLDPYLDEAVNRETLFCAVETAFTDGDGQLWGLAPSFSLGLLRAKDASLGPGTGAPVRSWSLDEFLAWAEQTPADTLVFDGCVREQLIRFGDLLVRDYGVFLDTENGTCAFDSPLFLRYLEWLESLPDEAGLTRIRGGLNAVQFGTGQGFESGRLLLAEERIGGLRALPSVSLPSEESLLSRPGASGADLSPSSVFLIPACAASPDLAWHLIRASLLSVESSDYLTPALKPVFRESLADYRGGRIAMGADGSVFALRPGEELIPGLQQMTQFRYADIPASAEETLLALFDNPCAPILGMTPPDVTAIVREEISAFLSGVGSAEDCAQKIQSRVSIWLAENK
ncbi:MAG: hypothetical protein II768_05515 [Clostridia bacterium]|nr:hypothetical protein [Clostridia bacterium]